MSFLISSDPSPGKPGFHSIHRGQSLSGLLFAHGYQISGGSEAEPWDECTNELNYSEEGMFVNLASFRNSPTKAEFSALMMLSEGELCPFCSLWDSWHNPFCILCWGGGVKHPTLCMVDKGSTINSLSPPPHMLVLFSGNQNNRGVFIFVAFNIFWSTELLLWTLPYDLFNQSLTLEIFTDFWHNLPNTQPETCCSELFIHRLHVG